MTIKQFFESKEKLAIHCDTEEKATKLCNEFDRLGYRWSFDRSYKDFNGWKYFKERTCYDNEFNPSTVLFCLREGYKMLEFEEIEFEN